MGLDRFAVINIPKEHSIPKENNFDTKNKSKNYEKKDFFPLSSVYQKQLFPATCGNSSQCFQRDDRDAKWKNKNDKEDQTLFTRVQPLIVKHLLCSNYLTVKPQTSGCGPITAVTSRLSPQYIHTTFAVGVLAEPS